MTLSITIALLIPAIASLIFLAVFIPYTIAVRKAHGEQTRMMEDNGKLLLTINQKIDKMDSNVQALTAMAANLKTVVEQLIAAYQSATQKIQTGIDAEDLKAIQDATTELTGIVGEVMTTLPAAPPVTPPATP